MAAGGNTQIRINESRIGSNRWQLVASHRSVGYSAYAMVHSSRIRAWRERVKSTMEGCKSTAKYSEVQKKLYSGVQWRRPQEYKMYSGAQ